MTLTHSPRFLVVFTFSLLALSACVGHSYNKMGGSIVSSSANAPATTIKAVYFDVGGVLAQDAIAPKKTDLAAKYNIDAAQLNAQDSSTRDMADLGKISDCQYWVMTLQQAGITADPKTDCDLTSYIQPVPGMVDLIKTLSGLKYKIGVLSNDSVEMADLRASMIGYKQYVTTKLFIVSSSVGIAKPDPSIFRMALSRTGLTGTQVLYVDNDLKNINAAVAAGMTTILFKDINQLTQDMAKLGVVLPVTATTAAKQILLP